MNLWSIAKANMRMKRAAAFSSYLLIALASLIMISAFSIVLNIDKVFKEKTEELSSPHYFMAVNKADYKEEYFEWLRNDERTQYTEKENVIIMDGSEIDYGGKAKVSSLFFDLDGQREIAPVKVVGQTVSNPEEDSIYIPFYGKLKGYQLGDPYKITYKNREYTFWIAGFYEATEYNSNNGGAIKYFLSHEAFESLYAEVGGSVALSVRLYDQTQVLSFRNDFKSRSEIEISAFGKGSFESDINDNLIMSTMSIKLMVVFFIAFSIFMILVILMMIRFRVSSSIEENIHNIGALGALGYTTKQIIGAILIEYGVLSFLGSLTGILSNGFLLSGIAPILQSVSGVIWKIDSRGWIGLWIAIGISGVILITAILSGRRIRNISPVEALRNGIKTHSFRKNHFPLQKGIGNIHVRLGCKNITANSKLYIMVTSILTVVTFILVIVVYTYINFAKDQTALLKMVGVEMSDVSINVIKHGDSEALVEKIEGMEQVRKTSMSDMVSLKLGGMDMLGFVSTDYSKMETLDTFEGTMPQYDNEIVTTMVVARNNNKEIGDMIEVKAGGVVREYLITGLTQSTMNGGTLALLTLDGYKELVPDYERTSINIYLKEGVILEEFIQETKDTFGVVNVKKQANTTENDPYKRAMEKAEEKISNYISQYGVDSVEYAVIYNGEIIISGSSSDYQIEEITNLREMLQSQMSALATSLSFLIQAISLISIVIISLIMSMVIHSIITKRKLEFGILKANGYTTFELMLQIAISFVPMTVTATIVGGIAGMLTINPILGVLFGGVGMAKFDFTLDIRILLVIGFLTLIIAFAIAMVSTYRMKYITAKDLLTD